MKFTAFKLLRKNMPLKEIIFLGNLLEFPKTFSTLNSNAVAYGFEKYM